VSDPKETRTAARSSGPGAHSLAEILSQPHCWSNCLKELEEKGQLEEIRERFADAVEWLFIGCGSSYYLALAAAASWSAITGLRARAIPASELLLFPDLLLAGAENYAAVLISRSGRTSEVLKAAEFLESSQKIATLAVTCTGDQPLERIASSTLALLPADEESTVMTRSFTSMLLALQYLAAFFAENHAFAKALRKLPTAAEKALQDLHPRLREFVGGHQFADYVCLGQGPFYGLACESTLKLTEMSVSYGQAFHTLEFRHGPKSIVGPTTLLVFLLSETGHAAESEVLQEVKGLGGTTLVLANHADPNVRASADFLAEFSFDVPELARLAAYVFAGQLLGLYTGLKKGLDPDRPRNLSRVVILDEEESPNKSEHAAL
jgi:glucosamine--fructose-6-phosphate aminotransferase (isomerizing)